MKLIGFMLLTVFGKFLSSGADFDSDNVLNFITERFLNKSHNEFEGLRADGCMISLIHEALKHFGSTFMFIKDGHNHSHLLYNLQLNFLHSYFTEPGHLSVSNSEPYYNLLIFREKFELKDVIIKKKPHTSTKFFILVRNYEEVLESFNILWRYRMVNVVASYEEHDNIYYYTYFPYCSTHCGEVGKPYLLAKCDIFTGRFLHKEKLFPSKVKNLHKCPINVTFTINLPASYYEKNKKLTGWEIELLNEILENINAVPRYKIVGSKKRVYKKPIGYRRLVETSEIGGGLVVSLRSLPKTDFCMYGMSMCTIWVVPKKETPAYSSDFLLKVFPSEVWFLLLLTYFTMVISYKTFYKTTYSNICLKLLPYLFGTSTRLGKVSRILGPIWLSFCLVMTSVYQSGFQSTILVPDTPQQSVTTKSVLKSNLKILGVNDIITDTLPYYKRAYNVSKRRLRNRRFTFEDWYHRMVVKKDSAFLGFKETLHYHIDKTEAASEVYISKACTINYLLAFVLKKNSHLTDEVVKFSNRLNANGILMYYVRKHLSRESWKNAPKKLTALLKPIKGFEQDEIPPPINIHKIYVVLKVLVIGVSLAFIVFLGEIISTWNWKKMKLLNN